MEFSLKKTIVLALSSGLGLSHLLYKVTLSWTGFWRGCGLVGTAWAFIFWWFLPDIPKLWGVFLAAALTLAAVPIAYLAESYYLKKDDPRIVIDEFVGFLWAIVGLDKSFGLLMLAALIFRILDVFKPFGIRKIEALPGGWGCVLDDAASGLLAGLIVFGLYKYVFSLIDGSGL